MRLIITPEYIKNFSCIAEKCEDHCCHSWDISIDKSTYQFMTQKSSLKVKSADVIMRTKGDTSPYYAKIRLNNDGVCPFREENGLCEVHKEHGHQRLSQTCQTYPRSSTIRGNKKEHNLYLSCPEAARQILLNPTSMQFHQKNTTNDAFDENNYTRPNWYEAVQQFIIDILFINNISLEQRLFYIGVTLRLIEPHKDNIEELQKRLQLCCEKINNNDFEKLYSEQRTSSDFYPSLLIKIFNYHINQDSSHSYKIASSRFNLLYQQLLNALSLTKSDSHKQYKILQHGFTNHYREYFAKNSHIWINYIIYIFYENDFPSKSMCQVFDNLIDDIFIIRGALSALASMRPLTDDDVILVIQTYHRTRSHNKDYINDIKKIRSEVGINEELLSLMLIKAH
ncbi:flagellin lysine-N-methylase [Photobacterium toruni]|uniref:Flagellar biosynthetic protein FliU n=1 Tax=Photobacterium toruni TaxID=1935446 RepID=A0A1T4SS21_9GAMM|nr:flagellin lysine-N-methylase [Photobacterium toruni]SKA30698.1 Flagellar biosynthetic protein FliU [Photobacterium toruni]